MDNSWLKLGLWPDDFNRPLVVGSRSNLRICAIGSINSHYFHTIGDGKLNPIVGVYIPIIRIPIKRWDGIPRDPGSPNVRWWWLGCTITETKRKVFRFQKTILRRWARIPRVYKLEQLVAMASQPTTPTIGFPYIRPAIEPLFLEVSGGGAGWRSPWIGSSKTLCIYDTFATDLGFANHDVPIVFLLHEICARVDQLPLFPYNRGWETQPKSVGVYRAPWNKDSRHYRLEVSHPQGPRSWSTLAHIQHILGPFFLFVVYIPESQRLEPENTPKREKEKHLLQTTNQAIFWSSKCELSIFVWKQPMFFVVWRNHGVFQSKKHITKISRIMIPWFPSRVSKSLCLRPQTWALMVYKVI